MKKSLKFISLTVVFITSIFTNILAEEDTSQRLLTAKTLKCYLENGSYTRWVDGKTNIEVGNFSDEKDQALLIFDSLNAEASTARMIGNAGSTDLTFLITPAGLHFMEQTPSGNLNFTTVYSSKVEGTDKYRGVFSRHVAILGNPSPSQYNCLCEVIE